MILASKISNEARFDLDNQAVPRHATKLNAANVLAIEHGKEATGRDHRSAGAVTPEHDSFDLEVISMTPR